MQKRLNEIGKKSEADKKAQNKMDEEIRKMNSAAMQSYAQDISTGGADISSRAISRANAKKAVDPMALANYESDEEFGPNVSKKAAAPAEESSLWCEARTDDGNTYYWNVKTNATKWSKPKEGFMSLAEYDKLNKVALQQQETQKQLEMKNSIDNADEIASRYNREQLKKYKKITEEPKTEAQEEASTSYATMYDGISKMGKWESVESKPERKPIDLELPKQEFTYVAVPAALIDEPPVKKFKEKTITNLGDAASNIPAVFKKRKFGGGARNIRKGDDDGS